MHFLPWIIIVILIYTVFMLINRYEKKLTLLSKMIEQNDRHIQQNKELIEQNRLLIEKNKYNIEKNAKHINKIDIDLED
ncbi:hypothetical protein LMG7974_00678 [Campylobacter majalis]|uniref:Flagellar biosynthesis protein n=1 Tax=Campylobacter majalis TaxID=2790656 RepID=A0ABM8Q4J3_9BACT|nr:hypothetical protein [Campylobacter majalis]CAD7287795.1 hypothetical protein LMG7974_00678 [Campylobacter majalis]